jgi:LysR family glycine cleavage system transcriptional activator
MDRRELPLTALRSFEATGRYMSIGRAAESLGVTHGAVSRQISALEETLGVRLFERGARLSLTDEGRQLFERVRPAFESLTEAVLDVMRRENKAVLAVDAPPTFTMKWLIPRLSNFQRRHPQIEVRLSTGINMPNLREPNVADVIIRRHAINDPQSKSTPFLSSSLLTVCAPDLIERRHIHGAADLQALSLLEAETSNMRWTDWFERAGTPARADAKITRLEQMFFVFQAALDGLGVALLPSALVVDDLASGRLAVPWLLPGIHERDYAYLVPPLARNRSAAAVFCSWLIAEGAEANKLGLSVIEACTARQVSSV